jgi:osmoprotectant transport system substrate-binding protein
MKRTPHLAAGRMVAGLVALASMITACGSSSATTESTTPAVLPAIKVTSVKGDNLSALVSAMYARVLESSGFRVSRVDPVSLDRKGYLDALAAGTIDLIPDFSHDVLKYLIDSGAVATTTTAPAGVTTTTLPKGAKNAGRSAAEQVLAVASMLPKGVAVGNPTLAENAWTIACTASATTTADKKSNLANLSGLGAGAPKVVLGAPSWFLTDPDQGLKEWTSTYTGTFKKVVTVEEGGVADALLAKKADCFVMNSLDPVITQKVLTPLTDDKAMFFSNAIVALLNAKQASSALSTALDKVNNALTTARINQMLNEIVANHTDPVVVANAFLDTL